MGTKLNIFEKCEIKFKINNDRWRFKEAKKKKMLKRKPNMRIKHNFFQKVI